MGFRLCLACFDLEKKNLEILNGFPIAKIDSLRRPDVETGGKISTGIKIGKKVIWCTLLSIGFGKQKIEEMQPGLYITY